MKEFITNLKFAWIYARDQKKEIIRFIFTNILHIFISLCVPILSAKIIIALTTNKFKQLLFLRNKKSI